MSFNTYQLLTEESALEVLVKISDMEWHQGKARTEMATGTIKQNLELKATDDLHAKQLLTGIQRVLVDNDEIRRELLLKQTLTPKFNRYTVDSPEYKRHGDSAVMGGRVRTDLSCTIFLTPTSEYDGGVLCIEDGFGGKVEIRGEPGSCVVYDGGNPHWVTPVTRGERICAVTWIESHVRDSNQREIITSLNRVLRKMEPDSKWGEEYTSLGIISGKLMRMWME